MSVGLLSLRRYQEELIASTLAALREQLAEGSRGWAKGEPHPASVVAQMATGGGKTHAAAALVHQYLAGALGEFRPKVQFWADLREITSDTTARFVSAGLDVGVIAASAPADMRRPAAPVQVVQSQTAIKRGVPPCDLLILDEAHICEGADLARALRAADPGILIGLTATPARGDGRGLGRTFRALVQGPQTAELQAHGHLVPCDTIAPSRGFLPRGLSRDPVRAYFEFAPGGRALVFCADRCAKFVSDAFSAAGVASEVLAADTHHKVRATQRSRLASGDLAVLCTVDCAIKGWDCPAVDTIILARPVSVPGVYLQMIGRALRPALGKSRARLIDLCGSVYLHGLPEEPRTWSLDDDHPVEPVTVAGVRYLRCVRCLWLGLAGQHPPDTCPRCGAPLSSIRSTQARRAEKMIRIEGLPWEKRRAEYRRHLVRTLRARLARRGDATFLEGWVQRKADAGVAEWEAKHPDPRSEK